MSKHVLIMLLTGRVLFGQLANEPTSQPTNLVFSVSFDSLILSFTASMGGADGYLILKSAGSSLPTGVPADGNEYNIGTWLTDAFVLYHGPSTSVKDSNLNVGAPYSYAIFAYNGSGSQRNYLTTGPLTGTQSTLVDTMAPTITGVSAWPYPATFPGWVRVSATIMDNHRVWTTGLDYRNGLETAFSHTVGVSARDGNEFSFIIPESGITKSGLFFKIGTSDFSGNLTTYIGTIEVMFNAGDISTASPEEGAYPFGFPAKTWRMFSVPLKLANRSVAQVLVEFGEPGNSTWKLFDGSYDVSTTAQFVLGKSYWLKQVHMPAGKQIALGTGTTASAADGQITLAPGWNQIANPFTFPVDWVTDTDAQDDAHIKGPIAYDGARYVGIGQTGSTPFTELKPWDGYWVYNSDSINHVLTIDPSGALGTLDKSVELPTGWRVQFVVRNGGIEDQYNFVGAADDAMDGEDRYDLPELPVIGDFVSVAFDHASSSGNIVPYTIEYQAAGKKGYVWDMTVNTNVSGRCHLSWTAERLPPDFVIRVMNVSRHELVADGPHVFRSDGSDPVRFRIWVGEEEFVSKALSGFEMGLPRSFALFANYPNPFNPGTTIRFDMARASHVRITVHNLLGQKVRTLVNDHLETGGHSVAWNGCDDLGRQVSSGIYICRMQTNEFTKSRKLVLVR